MSKHRREYALAVKAIQRVGIGMANSRCHDFDQHFASFGPFKVKLDNFQRLFGFECDSSARLHGAWISLVADKGFSMYRADAQV